VTKEKKRGDWDPSWLRKKQEEDQDPPYREYHVMKKKRRVRTRDVRVRVEGDYVSPGEERKEGEEIRPGKRNTKN